MKQTIQEMKDHLSQKHYKKNYDDLCGLRQITIDGLIKSG